MKRNRIHYLLLIISTIIIGLASRRFSGHLPEFINLGLGDALWALMMYWMVAFFLPHTSIRKLAIISLTICFLVEFSQLIQVDWLNVIRNNRLGALILGRGFLWSDLVAYSLGVVLGVAIEKYLQRARLFQTKIEAE